MATGNPILDSIEAKRLQEAADRDRELAVKHVGELTELLATAEAKSEDIKAVNSAMAENEQIVAEVQQVAALSAQTAVQETYDILGGQKKLNALDAALEDTVDEVLAGHAQLDEIDKKSYFGIEWLDQEVRKEAKKQVQSSINQSSAKAQALSTAKSEVQSSIQKTMDIALRTSTNVTDATIKAHLENIGLMAQARNAEVDLKLVGIKSTILTQSYNLQPSEYSRLQQILQLENQLADRDAANLRKQVAEMQLEEQKASTDGLKQAVNAVRLGAKLINDEDTFNLGEELIMRELNIPFAARSPQIKNAYNAGISGMLSDNPVEGVLMQITGKNAPFANTPRLQEVFSEVVGSTTVSTALKDPKIAADPNKAASVIYTAIRDKINKDAAAIPSGDSSNVFSAPDVRNIGDQVAIFQNSHLYKEYVAKGTVEVPLNDFNKLGELAFNDVLAGNITMQQAKAELASFYQFASAVNNAELNQTQLGIPNVTKYNARVRRKEPWYARKSPIKTALTGVVATQGFSSKLVSPSWLNDTSYGFEVLDLANPASWEYMFQKWNAQQNVKSPFGIGN